MKTSKKLKISVGTLLVMGFSIGAFAWSDNITVNLQKGSDNNTYQKGYTVISQTSPNNLVNINANCKIHDPDKNCVTFGINLSGDWGNSGEAWVTIGNKITGEFCQLVFIEPTLGAVRKDTQTNCSAGKSVGSLEGSGNNFSITIK